MCLVCTRPQSHLQYQNDKPTKTSPDSSGRRVVGVVQRLSTNTGLWVPPQQDLSQEKPTLVSDPPLPRRSGSPQKKDWFIRQPYQSDLMTDSTLGPSESSFNRALLGVNAETFKRVPRQEAPRQPANSEPYLYAYHSRPGRHRDHKQSAKKETTLGRHAKWGLQNACPRASMSSRRQIRQSLPQRYSHV